MTIRHVVSVSSGKDSVATLLIALDRFGTDNVIPIFCDTGNEHTAVHEHLAYLEQSLDIEIVRLRANFDAEIAGKRRFISRDQRVGRKYDTAPVFDADGNPAPKRDGRGNIITRVVKREGIEVQEPVQKVRKVGGGRKIRWSNKAKRRALSVLYPSGNPFLDLCMWKGRFPSRKAQFCTEELKRNIAVEYQMGLIDQGITVVSWQGVRRDESLNRRNAKLFERVGPKLYIYRPIGDWNAMQVFACADSHGIAHNPLYLQGCDRVGCMPCINCSKHQMKQISSRWPEHIWRISEWEWLVGQASKRGVSTFIPAPGESRTAIERGNIWKVVEWSKTTRGGRQYDLLLDMDDFVGCSSAYGLCD